MTDLKKHLQESGFTIVELLVVIVVIGILASISLVSYGGISQKAYAVSLQSDLVGVSNILKMYQMEYNGYPTAFDGNICPTAPVVSDRYCLKSSNGNILNISDYTSSVNNSAIPQSFTLKATNGNLTYQITNDSAPVLISSTISLSNSNGGIWTKNAPITINNFQSNFQTSISVPYRSAMKADFSDLRFYDATAGTELAYWVESYTASTTATIWVKTASNNNVVLYYGNSSATSSSNGTNALAFFDDFSGSSLDAKWNVGLNGGGTATVGSGLLTMYGPKASGGTVIIGTANPLSGSYIVRFRKRLNPNAGLSWIYVGSTNQATKQMNTSDCVNSEFRIGYTGGDCGISTLTPRTDDNVWHNIDIYYKSTSASVYIDGAFKQTINGSYDSSVNIGVSLINASWKGADATMAFDYIYARSYAITEPTSSIGTEASV